VSLDFVIESLGQDTRSGSENSDEVIEEEVSKRTFHAASANEAPHHRHPRIPSPCDKEERGGGRHYDG
jgi:hypothetical protein